MRQRLVALAARAPLLAALAALLMLLAARSSLLRILPGALVPVVFAGIAVALLPALLAPRSPLPGALAVTVPVLAAAAYDQSRLDWLRLLKDFGVAGAASQPDWIRVGLSASALLSAWAAHAVDTAVRLRASAVARGVPSEQARAATGVVLGRCALLAALGVLGAALVGALALAAQLIDLGTLLGGRAPLVVPLVAAALIALAAALVAGRSGAAQG